MAQYLQKIIDKENHGKILRDFLFFNLKMGHAQINSLKRVDNGIVVNGKQSYTNIPLQYGDIVSVMISDYKCKNTLQPLNIPLEIVYQDDYLAVINKPSGLATQGSALDKERVTLGNALAYIWGEDIAFHPVNRLDKGTSGLMVVAKNGYIHKRLIQEFHTSFSRTYYAITEGVPIKTEGVIDLPIAREKTASLRRVISVDGQKAVTQYEVIRHTENNALVKVIPLTGRTHQIRIHMSAIGCSLVGDFMYGKEDKDMIDRPPLHSSEVTFIHPITEEQMTFSLDLPDDMKSLLKRLNIADNIL